MNGDFKDLFGDSRLPYDAMSDVGEIENLTPRKLNEKQVRVLGAFVRPGLPGLNPQTFVLLEDHHRRRVRIFIGHFEAISIQRALDNELPERPFAYDLFNSILGTVGSTIDHVIIDDIWSETYYAKLTVVHNGKSVEIDCRPSDAINMAIRQKAPIYVAESVLAAGHEEN